MARKLVMLSLLAGLVFAKPVTHQLWNSGQTEFIANSVANPIELTGSLPYITEAPSGESRGTTTVGWVLPLLLVGFGLASWGNISRYRGTLRTSFQAVPRHSVSPARRAIS